MAAINRHTQIARRHRAVLAMPSISDTEPGIFAGMVKALSFLFLLQALHNFDDKP